MPVENLDQLKADFSEKNAALLKAIEQTTYQNINSLENKLQLASLRLQVIDSYHNLLSYVNLYPKSKNERKTNGWY